MKSETLNCSKILSIESKIKGSQRAVFPIVPHSSHAIEKPEKEYAIAPKKDASFLSFKLFRYK